MVQSSSSPFTGKKPSARKTGTTQSRSAGERESALVVWPSKVQLCLHIDPVCVVGATQILEGLVDIVASEIVAKTTLDLPERGWLVSRHQVDFLAGETTFLCVDTVAAGRARRLVGLVKEVARGGEPKDVFP